MKNIFFWSTKFYILDGFKFKFSLIFVNCI